MDHSSMHHSTMEHASSSHFHEDSSVQICDRSSMNMVMFMDGFHSVIFGDSSNSCVNLLFSSWTLDTRLKVYLAMGGLFLLGVGTEALSFMRKKLRHRKYIVFIHPLQALLGYLMMLGGMTFVIELLFSICSGLAYGYYYFQVRR